jgi:peptide subunit release factor 1 (eRF1)
VPQKIAESQVCKKCGKVMKVESSEELSDIVAEKAKNFNTKVVYISVDTREGSQFKELGGIGAFLRYKLG